MNLWHLTPDAPRQPERPCPGQAVELWIGTWPIEPDQQVRVACHVLGPDGRHEAHEAEAAWHHNEGPKAVVWTFAHPVHRIQARDRLTVRTNCPGILRWTADGWQTVRDAPLGRAGGAMAGLHCYSLTLDPFPDDVRAVEFTFTCTECNCTGDALCCDGTRQRVLIAAEAGASARGRTARRAAAPQRSR